MQQAAEARARRGIPTFGHEITEEEKRQEVWRIAFCMMFDGIGLATSLNILLFNEEESEMPYRFWFFGYGTSTVISLIYNSCLIREVNKGYVTKNSEALTFVLEV
jgi:hypothetical protein